MWFIGAILGGLFGALADSFQGFFYGALIGGVAGWVIGQGPSRRIAALETRVRELEKKLADGVMPAAAPAAASEPEPEPVFQTAPAAHDVEPAPVAEPVPAAMAEAVPEPEPVPAVPPGPTFWERLFSGNIVVKVGVIVLFFGIAFLLKYTYERIHVPIELRLTGAAAAGIALLVVGWMLRISRPGYALALQGGGIGVLYLVIFGAFRLFHLLPAPLAFGLLVAVAVFSAVLAVAQNSLTLAAIGVSGGFLAPVLASTGRGDHVALFSYYAVLNAGIVGIAWLKAWRILNILGFAFTFAIGWLWGARSYRAEYFASTEPFLLLFFAMYVAIPLLFARRRAVELKDYVDGTLVFGVPVTAFGLQAAMVRPFEYGAALSALGLGVFYMTLALALFRRTGGNLRLLVEAFVALSLAFGTLAIPLAFDGRMTSAAWALEGAAVIWIAMRQGRLLARLFGYALQFGAGVAFLWDVSKGYDAVLIANSFYIGSVFLAAAGLFCAAYIERRREDLHPMEVVLGYVLLGWGALWWFGGGVHEIGRHVTAPYQMHSVLAFVAASALAFSYLAAWCRWPSARWVRLVLYPAFVAALVFELWSWRHPFANLGAAVWGAAFTAHFWLLRRHADDPRELAEGLHAVGVWLLAILGAREAGWLIDTAVEGRRVWPSVAWAIVPAALLALLAAPRVQARWPLVDFARSYVISGGAPIAAFLAAWIFYANFATSGDPYPLPYVPLLNPLDLAVAAVFIVLTLWLRAAANHGLEQWLLGARVQVYAAFGIAGFVWLNGMLLRSLHHWADVPFSLHPMLSSRLVQAAFCILWMILALAIMVTATRRALRPLWITGAALMGVVVGKLFLVDLSAVGTVERIVSFLAVGVLMLLIGYLSPVPPRVAASST